MGQHSRQRCAGKCAFHGPPLFEKHKQGCQCVKHRQHETAPQNGKKICTRCSEEKELSEFHRRGRKDGRPRPSCIACRKEQEFGLSPKQQDELLASQGGGCAICRYIPQAGERLYIDHDHNDNRVRGFLCNPCNRALGLFKDDLGRVLAAARYLGGNRLVADHLDVAQKARVRSSLLSPIS